MSGTRSSCYNWMHHGRYLHRKKDVTLVCDPIIDMDTDTINAVPYYKVEYD